MKSLASIVLAAGKGTRMKSEKAKVTFPLAGKPMVQRVVDTALKVDSEKIVVVVGWKKESVVACLKQTEALSFVEQKEQLGTGHAVMMAEEALQGFEGDTLILCGDVPLLTIETVDKLLNHHRQSQAAVTVLTAILEDAGKYGRMLRDEKGRIKGIVEFKDATKEELKIQEFNTGIYCFDNQKLFEALGKISNENQQKEYYLTDTLGILYAEGELVESVVLEDLMEVSGVNSQEQLAELEDIYYDKVRKRWLNSGVMMHNPGTIQIGDNVVLEADVEIYSGTIIIGKTLVKSEAIIGANCIIKDAQIGNGAKLLGHNVLIGTKLADKVIMDYYQKKIN